MVLKQFQEYIADGIVKQVKANPERAKSLILEAERRINSLKERLDKLGIKNENANDYIEYCYEIIMHLIRGMCIASLSSMVYKCPFTISENCDHFVDEPKMSYAHTIRAKLYIEGYSSSGQGAHEAKVSYLRVLKFSEKEIKFIDQMRYFRNGISYY